MDNLSAFAADLKQVAEALIFSADEPVTNRSIAAIYASVTGENPPPDEDVEAAVAALNEAYRRESRVFRIHFWAGGYRMATEPAYAPFVRAMYAEQNERALSRSLMETAAIVAYRQPVTKPEIDFVRGVDSDYAIRKLMERSFIEITGRSGAVGRPLLYATTQFFLDQFGLSSLDDLPRPREIDELLSDPAFTREREQLLMYDRQSEPRFEANGDQGDGEADGEENG